MRHAPAAPDAQGLGRRSRRPAPPRGSAQDRGPAPAAAAALACVLLGAVALLGAGACGGAGEPADGELPCAAAEECPTAWYCHASDGRCHRAPPAPSGAQGQPCTSSSCDEGLRCAIAFPEERPVCRRLCENRAHCDPLAPGCFLHLREEDVFLCSVGCDPLALDPAESGCAGASWYCGYRVVGAEVAEPFLDCIERDAEPAGAGAPCAQSRECASGHACLEGACRRRCLMGSAGACGGGASCALLSPRERASVGEYGACAPG